MYKPRTASCADRIGEALKERQMRPSALCKIAKIPQSSLSLYLSGAYEPKQNRVYAMASALNVDVAWLLGYDVPMGTFAEHLSQQEPETITEKLTAEEYEIIQLFRSLDETGQNVMLAAGRAARK